MLVQQLNNNRSKKKAWMHEDQWAWYLIHTDPFADTDPEYWKDEPIFQYMKTSFGNNLNAQGPNGPNNTESDNASI
jgi:hypothetical protein